MALFGFGKRKKKDQVRKNSGALKTEEEKKKTGDQSEQGPDDEESPDQAVPKEKEEVVGEEEYTGETRILNRNPVIDLLTTMPESDAHFRITEHTIVVHTEEFVNI